MLYDFNFYSSLILITFSQGLIYAILLLKKGIQTENKTKISRILLFNTALDGQENDATVENFKKIISEIEKFEMGLK
jgi:hypothetical protein